MAFGIPRSVTHARSRRAPRVAAVVGFALYFASSLMPWAFLGFGGTGRGYVEEAALNGWQGEAAEQDPSGSLHLADSIPTYAVSLAVVAAALVTWLRLAEGIQISWVIQLLLNCAVASFGFFVLGHLVRGHSPDRPTPLGPWLSMASLILIVVAAALECNTATPEERGFAVEIRGQSGGDRSTGSTPAEHGGHGAEVE